MTDNETAFTQRGITDDVPVGAAEPRPVAEPVKPDNDPNAFTHYVWLADGRVIRANLDGKHPDDLGTRHYEYLGEDEVETSTPIVGVYAR